MLGSIELAIRHRDWRHHGRMRRGLNVAGFIDSPAVAHAVVAAFVFSENYSC
jgi:hypothetical protein